MDSIYHVPKTIEMMLCERRRPSIQIRCPADTYQALKRYHNKRQEHFLALSLDGAHNVIAIRLITMGLTNRTLVHPREVFAPAISDSAVAVILSHNHPSGKVDPSPEDRDITNRLVNAGELLGIIVLDHIVLSRLGYFSFMEHGLITKDGDWTQGDSVSRSSHRAS